MDAMILAAGRGTRLGPLGRRTPKVLLDVGGEPVLARQLRYLEREGVRRVVLNAHHLAAQVESFLNSYCGGLRVTLVLEERLLGTAGGVRNALPHLASRDLIVLYGDVLVDEPLSPLLAAHRRTGAVATLTLYEASRTEGKGVVEVDGHRRVRRFREKRQIGPGLVNAGLYVLERDFVARLPAGETLDFGQDVMPAAVRRGELVIGYQLAAPVIDIGTPDALEQARRLWSVGCAALPVGLKEDSSATA